ncbi:uncharacterized protein K444DRAFT_183743 [Hyaloscypha bicolor E]|uniref:Uncharacterized protein n=1 Tax=Hyaloscypha bicolor E TaxID=1095630 RepID=A0A2J6TRK6_9HELO|nr:uncharacterized protein K444DRAFT_183743 [Hyaloscypha bicolor E]PMD65622.1 hypothetical protein K444DRAFT_183743 [Hyaloscypha bicolor E]
MSSTAYASPVELQDKSTAIRRQSVYSYYRYCCIRDIVPRSPACHSFYKMVFEISKTNDIGPLCLGGLAAGSFATTLSVLIFSQGVIYGIGFVIFYYSILSFVNEFWENCRRDGLWTPTIAYLRQRVTGHSLQQTSNNRLL